MQINLKKILIDLIPIKSIRRKYKHKYFPKKKNEFKILKNTKCLVVCPHPDDEMIGCGGTMLKYAENIDCICMASAGLAYKDITPEERANIRIKEFDVVMKKVGIKNYWIFKTYGVPPMCDQIEEHFNDYCKTIETSKYDYIFLPHPNDAHVEHQYITNILFKKLLKKKGFKKDCIIVFYEVWQPIGNVNHFEDISDVAQKKFDIIDLYASQNVWIKYPDRVEGLNKYRGMLANNIRYAEAFTFTSIKNYLNKDLK